MNINYCKQQEKTLHVYEGDKELTSDRRLDYTKSTQRPLEIAKLVLASR